MKRTVLLGVTALLATALAPPVAAHPLEPFEARYEVWLNGKRSGISRMQLAPLVDGSWEYRVEAEGSSGLARLAAIELRQAVRFELIDQRPRLLESVAENASVLRRREVRTLFDWQAMTARWEGDVKPGEAGPLPLERGATTGQLLNLLLALNVAAAPPDSVLSFPVYERGRMKRQQYRIEGREPIEVPAGRFAAIPVVNERPDRQRTTRIWYDTALPPTPVRMLQTEQGQPKYELRLIEVSGGPANDAG